MCPYNEDIIKVFEVFQRDERATMEEAFVGYFVCGYTCIIQLE